MEVYNSSHTAEEFEYALGAVPNIGENGNWYIGDTDTGIFAGGVDVSGAEVGQFVKIAAVDENGRPTAWEPAEGGAIPELLWSETFENVTNITQNIDWKGHKNIYIAFGGTKAESAIRANASYLFINGIEFLIGYWVNVLNTTSSAYPEGSACWNFRMIEKDKAIVSYLINDIDGDGISNNVTGSMVTAVKECVASGSTTTNVDGVSFRFSEEITTVRLSIYGY